MTLRHYQVTWRYKYERQIHEAMSRAITRGHITTEQVDSKGNPILIDGTVIDRSRTMVLSVSLVEWPERYV